MRYMVTRNLLKMNLYIWIVATMTITCLLWNATFFLQLYVHTETHGQVYQMLIGAFGTANALWNFCLVAMVYRTAAFGASAKDADSMHFGRKRWMALLVITLVSTAVGVYMYLTPTQNAWHFYDLWRLSIATLSLLVLLALVRILYNTTNSSMRWQSPLYALLCKMALYPLGNIFSVAASMPYDLAYGVPLHLFPANAEATQTFALFLFILITPSCGIFDFIIFCRMQRGRAALRQMLGVCLHNTDADKDKVGEGKGQTEMVDIAGTRNSIPAPIISSLRSESDYTYNEEEEEEEEEKGEHVTKSPLY